MSLYSKNLDFDPNTKLTAEKISALSSFSKAELKYNMMGFGYNIYLNDNVKIMLYYNHVLNESTTKYSDFLDDIFTAKVQYRF